MWITTTLKVTLSSQRFCYKKALHKGYSRLHHFGHYWFHIDMAYPWEWHEHRVHQYRVHQYMYLHRKLFLGSYMIKGGSIAPEICEKKLCKQPYEYASQERRSWKRMLEKGFWLATKRWSKFCLGRWVFQGQTQFWLFVLTSKFNNCIRCRLARGRTNQCLLLDLSNLSLRGSVEN